MNAVTRDCPIACLASLLSRTTLDALIVGIVGSPATIGQLIELCECSRLTDIFNIGPSRAGEIRWALVQAKLMNPERRPLIQLQRPARHSEHGHDKSCPCQDE